MDEGTLHSLLLPYNPWRKDISQELEDLPSFRRPAFDDIVRDIEELKQIVSITGPRRVGKSTLLRQIIKHYLDQEVPPQKLIYYSLDDPALFRPGMDGHDFIESLMLHLNRQTNVADVQPLLFLDEIQRLDRWELYLKKYYDLNFPVRIVVSGSASSPIFKKSRESLLGRVKDHHFLPFSFREFLLYKTQTNLPLLTELKQLYEDGNALRGMVVGDPRHLDLQSVSIHPVTDDLWKRAEELFQEYIREGGFPEVWSMKTWEQKTDYLLSNQINKVIYEDLVLAAEFRKPEQLKRFYISLLERPGREVNLTRISSEIGINHAQIEKYLPLLEMTDLVYHIGKFRGSSVRIRRGNVKFYLVDLALRNAVLRLPEAGLPDDTTMGLYAENVVFNALKKWKGALAIDYYREKDMEVDFIVHVRPGEYLPFEVKYSNTISDGEISALDRFTRKYRSSPGIVVSKNRSDFGIRSGTESPFFIPLLAFLLVFD